MQWVSIQIMLGCGSVLDHISLLIMFRIKQHTITKKISASRNFLEAQNQFTCIVLNGIEFHSSHWMSKFLTLKFEYCEHGQDQILHRNAEYRQFNNLFPLCIINSSCPVGFSCKLSKMDYGTLKSCTSFIDSSNKW